MLGFVNNVNAVSISSRPSIVLITCLNNIVAPPCYLPLLLLLDIVAPSYCLPLLLLLRTSLASNNYCISFRILGVICLI